MNKNEIKKRISRKIILNFLESKLVVKNINPEYQAFNFKNCHNMTLATIYYNRFGKLKWDIHIISGFRYATNGIKQITGINLEENRQILLGSEFRELFARKLNTKSEQINIKLV